MNYAPDLTTAAIKMVLALGVVLLIVWGLQRLAKAKLSTQSAVGRNKVIQIVASQYLGVKKNITLVQIPGSVLVLGVGADSVNLLTRIDDQEIIRGITSESREKRPKSFKDQLQRLTHPRRQNDAKHPQEATVT